MLLLSAINGINYLRGVLQEQTSFCVIYYDFT